MSTKKTFCWPTSGAASAQLIGSMNDGISTGVVGCSTFIGRDGDLYLIFADDAESDPPARNTGVLKHGGASDVSPWYLLWSSSDSPKSGMDLGTLALFGMRIAWIPGCELELEGRSRLGGRCFR